MSSRDREHALGIPKTGECDIRLTLPARPENVALVRQVIGCLADTLSFPASLAEDIRLAVTEACTNVVRHAYRGHEGPMEVVIHPMRDTLTIVVADRGRGILPNPSSEGPGLGLPLIAALAETLEIDHSPMRGSRLTMTFQAEQGSATREAA